MANIWSFSVANESVAETINAALASGAIVECKYHSDWMMPWWKSGSGYLIDNAKEIEQKTSKAKE